MKKAIFISMILILQCLNSYSQRTLVEEDVSTYDFEKPKNGPNLLHFTHWYLALDFYAPNPIEENIKCQYATSHNFMIGYRYKLRVTNWLALGADAEFYTSSYYFEDDFFYDITSEINTNHNKEKLRLNNFGTEVYIRFNCGKRGNVIGKFIDFAAYGLVNFDAKHIYIDKFSTPHFYDSKTVKVVNSNLNYIEFLNYGARFRIGYNRFAVSFAYRLSDILTKEFKSDNNQLELPRFSVGLQVGLH